MVKKESTEFVLIYISVARRDRAFLFFRKKEIKKLDA